jgi:hypothetical protein
MLGLKKPTAVNHGCAEGTVRYAALRSASASTMGGMGRSRAAAASATALATTAGNTKWGVVTVSRMRVAALAPFDLPSSIARTLPFCSIPNRLRIRMTKGLRLAGVTAAMAW